MSGPSISPRSLAALMMQIAALRAGIEVVKVASSINITQI
jgi:hypothetical protein